MKKIVDQNNDTNGRITINVWAIKKKNQINVISIVLPDECYILRPGSPVIQYSVDDAKTFTGRELLDHIRQNPSYKDTWGNTTLSPEYSVDCTSMKNKLGELVASKTEQMSLVGLVRDIFECAGLKVRFSVHSKAPLLHKLSGSSDSSSNLAIHQTFENLKHLFDQLQDKEEELLQNAEYSTESNHGMK